MSRTHTGLFAVAILVAAASSAFAQSANVRRVVHAPVATSAVESGCQISARVYDCAMRPTPGETATEALMYQRSEELND